EHALVGKTPPSPQGDLWTTVTGTSAEVDVDRQYSQVPASTDLAEAFGSDDPKLPLLCRFYTFTVDGQPHQAFWSYLRWNMVDGTPLADPANERPDRGTMSQLAELGIEITSAEMTVRTRMPTPEE